MKYWLCSILCFGLFGLATLYAAPSAVRSIPASCASTGRTFSVTLSILPGSPIPSTMIVRETLPVGWAVTSAVWNGSAIATTLDGGWLFGFGDTPVGDGTLVYVVSPTSSVVNLTYDIQGSILYSNGLIATTTGDYRLTACDQDGDGLPDDWEALYFGGNPTGAVGGVDSDGDGAVNRHEYQSRTDPCNPESFFGFAGIEESGGDFVLRVRAPESSVTVQFMPELGTNAVPENVAGLYPSTEGVFEVSIPTNFLTSSGFFRLLMQ